MTKTLMLLALAVVACLVIGVTAVILKFTAALALVGVAGVAILVTAVWLLLKSGGSRASS